MDSFLNGIVKRFNANFEIGRHKGVSIELRCAKTRKKVTVIVGKNQPTNFKEIVSNMRKDKRKILILGKTIYLDGEIATLAEKITEINTDTVVYPAPKQAPVKKVGATQIVKSDGTVVATAAKKADAPQSPADSGTATPPPAEEKKQ
jgi:predicted glycosyltransferase